jgi:hypothetical protein
MANPTLEAAFNDLQGDIGFFLGWGRGLANGDLPWTDLQQASIDRATKGGMRDFYFCGYSWSYLRPTATFDFALNSQTILLPDDFGGFEGPLTILTTIKTSQPWRIEWRNEGEIRRMYSVTPQMSGPPMYATQNPIKGTTFNAGTRFELMLFPAADQDYQVQGTYYVNPDYLSGAFPYAYGGPQHSETLLEACLSKAEKLLDDQATTHSMEFQRKLAESQRMDARMRPQKVGRNLDRSDDFGERWNPHWYAGAGTYNGQSFG